MNFNLAQLETRIRELVEFQMSGLLTGQPMEQQMIRRLAELLHRQAAEAATAANVYTLLIHPDEAARWEIPGLLDRLRNVIRVIANEIGITFSSPPLLSISTDTTISPGDIQIIVSYHPEPVSDTHAMPASPAQGQEEPAIPENAFLVIEGRRVFPLTAPVINIGRRLENHLVIDDPRVSRQHAQLRAIRGRYVIFDLNSTGGTFVNGQRVNQSILYPGDVISLAGVTLIYGQDTSIPRTDLRDTGPISSEGQDRTTAVFRRPSDLSSPS